MDFDPKKKVLAELMQYLNSKDDEDLGGIVKPKSMDVEVAQVEGDGLEAAPEAPEAEAISDGDATSGMSDDELSELIEALSNKVG